MTRGAGLLFTCGIPPVDPVSGKLVQGSITDQTRAVLDLADRALTEAGSGLDRVLRTTIYITDAAHMAEVDSVYGAAFAAHQPARSVAAVKGWSFPFDIEIDFVALA